MTGGIGVTKIIVLDLDGTLLKDDKTVSDKTLKTLLECQEAGNILIFATARAPRDMSLYIPLPKELLNNPIICYNGACIIEGGNFIYKKEIDKFDISKVLSGIKKVGEMQVCIEVNNRLFSNFDIRELLGDVEYQREDVYSLNIESAYKIMVGNTDGVKDELFSVIPNSCKVYRTDNKTLFQIVNSEASKWTAIEYLLSKQNISQQDVIAFGNDYNDIDMITNAGTGVAMKNAIDELKAIAKFVTTESNNDDGVSRFLQENKELYY